MRKFYSFISIFSITSYSIMYGQDGQQNYCDFEGNNVLSFGICTGTIDTMFMNPAPNGIDSSMHCAKYIRDTIMYDYIKMYPDMKLEDITLYANSSTQAPRMTMKLYSTAPVGTLVNLQLGVKSVDNYPSGIHSEYMATTTVQNAWELLTFNYFQTNTSFATPTEIDKIVLLFQPGTLNHDTMYFDDLTGPVLMTPANVQQSEALPDYKLFQNNPNPAKQSTSISFQLNSKGAVSLEVFDLIGNSILSVLNGELKAGSYSIPVDTSELPDGIYFYTLKKDGMSQSKRMIVAK